MEILGDRFATRQLDFDDYQVFNRDAPALATGFLTHVLTEYTTAAQLPSPLTDAALFDISHQHALVEEAKAVSDITGTLTAPRSDTITSGNIDPPPMTIQSKFYSVQYDIVFKSGANGRATQADRVITTKQDSKKGSKP